MTNQEISVLFEVISFFFVGIDLYGSTRLNKAHARLKAGTEWLDRFVSELGTFEWNEARSSRFMKSIYVFAALIVIISALIFLYGLFSEDFFTIAKEPLGTILLLTFFGVLLAIIALVFSWGIVLLLLLLLFVFVGLPALYLIIYSTKGISWLMINLLTKYQLEGIFLLVGTALFIASKYFQLY